MKIKILTLLITTLFLSGCYNYREINDLALVNALGIDKNEEGYSVSVQVVNTQGQGAKESNQSSNNQFFTYTSKGITLQSAYTNVLNESGSYLYMGHMQIIVISDKVAKNGIENILDLFMRDNEFRKQALVIVSENSSEKILSTVTSLITLNAENIKEILLNNEKILSKVKAITLEEVANIYLNKKEELALPMFYIENLNNESDNSENLKEAESQTKLKYKTMSIFKNNKLVGYLNDEENIAFALLKGNPKDLLLELKCDENNYYALELTNIKTEFKNIKNTLNYTINLKANSALTEMNCDINVEDDKTITKLEKQANEYIQNLFINTINNIKQVYNSDIFGFENLLYKTSPNFYEKIKNNFYENNFKDINVKINSKITIVSRGNSIKEIK